MVLAALPLGAAAAAGAGGGLAAGGGSILTALGLSSLLGAGGSVAGGLLASQGGLSNGDMILPNYDPNFDFNSQVAGFDARSQIGFARPDMLLNAGPLNELIGRINASQLDEKIKRRALLELSNLSNGANPATLNYKLGRPINESGRYTLELEAALSRFGLTENDLPELFQKQKQYEVSIQPLVEQLGITQDDVIQARLSAARSAAEGTQAAGEQLAAAAGFARGGVPQNALQQTLLDIDNRKLADLKDRLGVMANFGNISPGTMFESLIDNQINQSMRLLQQSLGASGLLSQGAQGITGALNGSSAGATNAANSSQQANSSSAAIAAQQAQAVNQIRNQNSLDNALSLANGVSGFGNSLQQGAFDAATLWILGKREGLI